MNESLSQDLQRFFRVYQANVEEAVRKRLPSSAANVILADLADEFEPFRQSIINRLEEEFRP